MIAIAMVNIAVEITLKERAMERFGVDSYAGTTGSINSAPPIDSSSLINGPIREAYGRDGKIVCDLKGANLLLASQAVNLTVDLKQKRVCQDIHRENVLSLPKHSQSSS